MCDGCATVGNEIGERMNRLPCRCGSRNTELRQNGYHFRYGRSYPLWIHACDPCWEHLETERTGSRSQ